MIDGKLNELDLAILRALPDEGTKLGKYLQDARSAKQLQRELDDEYVTSLTIGRALAEMKKADLVVGVVDRNRAVGDAHGKMTWQRTNSGKKALQRQGGEEDST